MELPSLTANPGVRLWRASTDPEALLQSIASGQLDPIYTCAERWGLHPPERVILSLAYRGLEDKEIADHIHRSWETVRSHWMHIYQRSGLPSARQVLTYISRTLPPPRAAPFPRSHDVTKHGPLPETIDAKADAILSIVRARGLRLSAEQHGRLLRCTDTTVLDSWIRRAARIGVVEEIFE